MVQARDLGDTFLVIDSYGQGDLLGSEEAKRVVDLVVWGMFADPAALGTFGIEEMLQSLTCGHRQMICPYHPNREPGKSWIRVEICNSTGSHDIPLI